MSEYMFEEVPDGMVGLGMTIYGDGDSVWLDVNIVGNHPAAGTLFKMATPEEAEGLADYITQSARALRAAQRALRDGMDPAMVLDAMGIGTIEMREDDND